MATELIAPLAETALALVSNDEERRFLPVMALATAVRRHKEVVQAIQELLTPSTKDADGKEQADGDFGTIPGTKKKTLFQPGADKLNFFFGLVPHFQIEEQSYDWTGEHHGGEPFFYIKSRCQLWRGDPANGGHMMGEGFGSCNSWETKYRNRKEERKCPSCGAGAIIKGREEYGGGWVCFKKKDGCGAKFRDGDQEIESQQVGTVKNPDIFEVVNTIEKIACKRAKLSATLTATGATQFFAPDIDDFGGVPGEPKVEAAPQPPARNTPANKREPKQRGGEIVDAEFEDTRQPDPPPARPAGASEEDSEVLALWTCVGRDPEKIKTAIKQFQTVITELAESENPAEELLKPLRGKRTSDPDWMRHAQNVLREMLFWQRRFRRANTPPPAEDEFDKHLRESTNVN